MSSGNEDSKIEQSIGVIALFDALGVRNSSIESSKNYIKIIKTSKNTYKLSKDSSSVKNYPQEIRTFGDSVMMIWDFKDIDEKDTLKNYMEDIITICAHFVANCFKNKILMRGVISQGEYLKSNETIIGPCITDAASWYERAEWIGCMATPNFSHWLNAKCLNDEYKDSIQLYRYDVPIKENKTLKTWCLDWPNILASYPTKRYEDEDSKATALRQFSEICAEGIVSYGNENKYINTLNFFKTVLDTSMIDKYRFKKETILNETYGEAKN